MVDTPASGRTLEVRVSSVPGDGVQVDVSDQGCGISDTSDRSLFQPFFTTKKSGLGLGLNIS